MRIAISNPRGYSERSDYALAQFSLIILLRSVRERTIQVFYRSVVVMKYGRMFCWVRPHEKKELEKAANGRIPLVFAKNYEEFKENIKQDDYLIVSLSKAKFGRKKILELHEQFPLHKIQFYEIKDAEFFSVTQFNTIFDTQSPGAYLASDLVNNFLGIIPDLWEKRKEEEKNGDWKYIADRFIEKVLEDRKALGFN